jgi:D-serine deaminase-like pyridoxal phosphate-dependent protein
MGTRIPVLIDIDIGMDRTGILPGAPVLELAQRIFGSDGLEFEGIMGYEGHILGVKPPEEKIRQCGEALDRLLECRDLLVGNGVSVGIVSAGGTGCYSITTAYQGITEVQAGGGIFMDAKYREQFSVDTLDFALTVLGTVTSRHPSHLVLDAGFKVMSAYHEPPRTLDRKDLTFRYLSSDCGVWEVAEGSVGSRVGDQIELIVGYSDSTMFLHRRLIGLREGVVEKVWKIVLPS